MSIDSGQRDLRREIAYLDELIASLDEKAEERDAEIERLRGMVRDLYLWFNCALDDELTDEGREALCGEIPTDRWREIKAVVGEAADMDEQP